MRKLVFILSVLFCLTSCLPDYENKYISYENIVILSDLSSRLENRPSKDFQEINKILKYFKLECVKPGKKIGDKSSIYFSGFSDGESAKIDLGDFKELSLKQQFVNSTGQFRKTGLDYRIHEFEKKVHNVYSTTRNKGLDLISILIEKIEKESFVKKGTFLTDGIDTTFINFNNNIYIFTDGYLEYLNKSQNKQFYFGQQEINKVRKYCIVKHVGIAKALQDNPAFCLPPYKGKNNKYVTLNVMEAHERDKNVKNQTYLNPLGLRDNEILEAVWRKWAIESGFKDFKWDKY